MIESIYIFVWPLLHKQLGEAVVRDMSWGQSASKYYIKLYRTREYWMIHIGPCFLGALWFGSTPTPYFPSHLRKLERRHTGSLRKIDDLLTSEGVRKGVGVEPNHLTAGKPGPLKTFNTLCTRSCKEVFLVWQAFALFSTSVRGFSIMCPFEGYICRISV